MYKGVLEGVMNSRICRKYEYRLWCSTPAVVAFESPSNNCDASYSAIIDHITHLRSDNVSSFDTNKPEDCEWLLNCVA
jgi:hypothetical protein